MKFILTALLSIMISIGKCTDSTKLIKLPTVDLSSLASLDYAYKNRKSEREFSTEQLPIQLISNILWAANGVNRENAKKRTAPSARNFQEIDIFIIMKDGSYKYDAFKHSLELITEKDLRPLVAVTQNSILDAPLILLYVIDFSKYGENSTTENAKNMAAIDVGLVSQNVNIFCAAANLATVPRAWMDTDLIKKELKLKKEQVPLLNNPIGFRKNIKE